MSDIHKTLCNIQAELVKITKTIETEHVETDATTTAVRRNSSTPQLIARRNNQRHELWLHNKSDVDLLLGVDDGMSSTKYAIRVKPNDTLIMNANNYSSLFKREIYGFWADDPAEPTYCMVTEFYRKRL